MKARDYIESQNVAGYGCIYATAYTRDDLEKLKKSKVAKQLEQFFSKNSDKFGHNVPDTHYDVLVNNTRKRVTLLELIHKFKYGQKRFASLRGIIIIYDLTALGTTAESVYENYMELLYERIGLYIISEAHAEYRSVELFDEFSWIPWDVERNAKQILELKFKTNQGRNKGIPQLSDDFIEAYWAYENYHIPEELAYNSLGISRMTFKKYCAVYESSQRYQKDESERNAIVLCGDCRLEDKPKRFGKPSEQILEHMVQYMQGMISLDDAARELGISSITFKRFCLKGTGRKAMSKATALYIREDAIQVFQAICDKSRNL